MKNNLLILKGEGKSSLLDFFLEDNEPYYADEKSFKDVGTYLSRLLDKEYVVIEGHKKINWDLIHRIVAGGPISVSIPYKNVTITDFKFIKLIILVPSDFDLSELSGGIKRRAKIINLSV